MRPIILLAVFALGCTNQPVPPPSRPVASPNPASSTQPSNESSTARRIREIVADQLGVSASKLFPETSMADLGADDLDLVELVMELEEEFDVSISDDAIMKMQGTHDSNQGMKNITLGKLAEHVEMVRRSSGGAEAEQK